MKSLIHRHFDILFLWTCASVGKGTLPYSRVSDYYSLKDLIIEIHFNRNIGFRVACKSENNISEPLAPVRLHNIVQEVIQSCLRMRVIEQ